MAVNCKCIVMIHSETIRSLFQLKELWALIKLDPGWDLL